MTWPLAAVCITGIIATIIFMICIRWYWGEQDR
jgi:hypothetical protein